MHSVLHRSNIELQKQRKFEQELEELRTQMRQAERRVEHQKAFLKNVPPALKMLEKTVLTDRNAVMKWKNECNRIGTDVLGPKYK